MRRWEGMGRKVIYRQRIRSQAASVQAKSLLRILRARSALQGGVGR